MGLVLTARRGPKRTVSYQDGTQFTCPVWGRSLLIDSRPPESAIGRRGDAYLNLDGVGAPPVSPPSEHLSLSVVIPTKNEERNIAWVLERLPREVDEVVLVDGQSTDRTLEVARIVRPDVRIVLEPRRGKGAAVRAGIEAASGFVVAMLDADCSMDPQELPRFVEPVAAGVDLVKGSRFVQGGGTSDMTRLRRLGNWGLVKLANELYGTSFTELCYGYMAFRRQAMLDLNLRSDGFEIETEMVVRAVRAGYLIEEVPSFEAERRFGVSNLNTFRDGSRVLRTMLRERRWSAASYMDEVAGAS
jgi:glycosyltransferase involved in cell wall biosynthesis